MDGTFLDIQQLHRTGWTAAHLAPSAAPDLATWASRWGTPIPSRLGGPLIDRLRIRETVEAPPRSLSARYGTGAFPFHTDQAKLSVPPRYLVLRCLQTDDPGRATLLQPLDQLDLPPADLDALRRAVWVVDGGRGRFTSALLSASPTLNTEILRFDPSYMRPAHPRFAEAGRRLTDALAEQDPVRIEWEPGLTVAIDNWRVLHARAEQLPAAEVISERRVLERVLLSPLV